LLAVELPQVFQNDAVGGGVAAIALGQKFLANPQACAAANQVSLRYKGY